ncbi:hypothetical protein NM208_g6495 [Fusarium decemcellulare]|uniref:Uncharacterized protein n=1 Tax=Fusarium decemcellulare TaxID=57161 RepID=A0ACC1SCS6_9HYPO|nr:hypothetical protein NM208_g6495 [Fusarium decemcellulare]
MFTHRPLSQGEREIRLLRFTCVATGPVDDSEPISLELQHVSLNDEISYAAVSYTWGSTAASIEVEINGSRFKITQNLHEALQQFRRDGIESWLWIDAICIEQSNEPEKAWQIMEMREIFGRAKTVYLWLGTGTTESDLTMDLICRFGPRAQSCDAANSWHGTEIEQKISSYIEKGSCLQETDDNTSSACKLARLFYDLLNEEGLQTQSPLITGILDVLQRDYWHRIWIIQEVVLAKEARVVAGAKSVSLEDFDATFTAIWRCASFRRMRPEWDDFCMDLSGTLYDIKSLYIRRHQREIPTRITVQLVDILWESGIAPGRPHYSATDPRDILFGLLGILTEDQTRGICVDYTKSVSQVFTTLTRLLMSAGKGVSFSFNLDFCNPGEPTADLPTWVPNWQEIGMWGVKTYRINYSGTYKATGRSRGQVAALSVEGPDNILHRFGCRVDVITEVMHPPEWILADPYSASIINDADNWFRSIAAFTKLGPESGPEEDYIWRTVMSLESNRTLSATGKERVSLNEDTRALNRKIMRMQHVDAESLTDQEVKYIRNGPLYMDFGSSSQALNDEQVSSFVRQRRWYLGTQNRNRTLFKTSEGMLGLGHVGIETGDIVTLIWGVCSPIILRQRPDGGFYFRGDAYVDGIMQGEYLENDPIEEEFCIY